MPARDRNRLEQLKLENQARLLRPNWTAQLSSILETTIEPSCFLSPDQTLELRHLVVKRIHEYAFDISFEFLPNVAAKVWEVLHCAAEHHHRRTSVFFHDRDRILGAVRVPLGLAYQHAEALWRFGHEDFTVVDESMNAGVIIELNYYDHCDVYFKEGIFSLSAWGDFRVGIRNPDANCK